MKKPRKDWAALNLPPVTIEELDSYLDFCAGLMARASRADADLCLPVYRRLKAERDARAKADTLIADALARAARRTADQTVVQSWQVPAAANPATRPAHI